MAAGTGRITQFRRPGPAWWSTSTPRKRGLCCIACVALCTARLCPTPSAHLVQQGEVPVREPPQAEHCANGWADRVLLMAHALSLRLRADIEIWVAGGGAASRQAGWPAERGGAVVIFTVREAWQVTCARRARGCSAAARWRAGGPDGGGLAVVSSPAEAAAAVRGHCMLGWASQPGPDLVLSAE